MFKPEFWGLLTPQISGKIKRARVLRMQQP